MDMDKLLAQAQSAKGSNTTFRVGPVLGATPAPEQTAFGLCHIAEVKIASPS